MNPNAAPCATCGRSMAFHTWDGIGWNCPRKEAVTSKDESFKIGALRARLADTSMRWSRSHIEGLINQIAELTKQRDEGWNNFYALRKQVAEEKYPGMTGIVRAHETIAPRAWPVTLPAPWAIGSSRVGDQPRIVAANGSYIAEVIDDAAAAFIVAACNAVKSACEPTLTISKAPQS